MLDYERRYKIDDSYYTFLLQKRSEAQIRKASNSPDNAVMQKARTSQLVNANQKQLAQLQSFLSGLWACQKVLGVDLCGEDTRGIFHARSRSEERRVGKECRSRWSPYH